MPDSEVSMFLSAHTDSFLSFSFENVRNACAKGLWHHVKTKASGKDKNMVIPVFLTLLEKLNTEDYEVQMIRWLICIPKYRNMGPRCVSL